MTQQRAQRAYFGSTWPEVAGFGEAPQQAALRDCGHSHIACRFVVGLNLLYTGQLQRNKQAFVRYLKNS